MKFENILIYSGLIPKCKALKKQHYELHDFLPGGDAPKDFIKAYFYKKGEIRSNKWNYYIAKVGHKHYPIESITEHLLNDLGTIFGLNMAESELACVHYSGKNQIRFFSKYFMDRRSQQLIHGADIYAAYLGDEEIIQQIEDANEERDLITVQEAMLAIAYLFPENNEIFAEYIKLLLFDALVGNNDRHFYNWGCIKSLSGDDTKFSPIYDTARGLLWNISDDQVSKWHGNKSMRVSKLNRYSIKSMPKVGWNGEERINHFDLVGLIFADELGMSQETISNFYNVSKLEEAKEYILNGSFKTLFTTQRLELIVELLTLRFDTIKNIIR